MLTNTKMKPIRGVRKKGPSRISSSSYWGVIVGAAFHVTATWPRGTDHVLCDTTADIAKRLDFPILANHLAPHES